MDLLGTKVPGNDLPRFFVSRLNLNKKRGAPWDASQTTTRRPTMARTLTLSALYILSIGTLFGAYALTL